MELRQQYDKDKLKKLQKYKCCGICFLVTGLILVITCAFVPMAMNAIIGQQAKKSSQLTPENEPDWKGIPGPHDLTINWNQYFYKCTNPDEVTYANAKPEFQEVGPYVYREFDTYNDLVYGELDNEIGQETLNTVYNKFVQGNNFTSDAMGDIDTPIHLTNQALYGVWYQQNAAQANETQWRVYLTLLYSAVQDGLGRQVIQQGAWMQMHDSKFKNQDKINKVFVPKHHVSDEQATALYTDPYYGLQNYTNYGHWDQLVYTEDPLKKQQQMVWLWELRTYFNLSFEQVEEMQQNWNTFYNDEVQIVLYSVPTVAPYQDQTGVAYWQWADSYMTEYRSDPAEPSVADSTDTVTGYVEYNYWLNYYCDPTMAGAMSQDNWEVFKDAKMYRSKSDPNTNMEHLFTLLNPLDGGDPAENSLFNLTTLQALVKAGQETPNIILDKDIKYLDDFTLGQEWTNLAEILDLSDPGSQDGIGTKRAYMLWLWMQTAWDLTFARTQNGGSFQIGVIGTLGATAFNAEMTTMSLEMPMLTIATQMEQDFNAQGLSCQDFYQTNFKELDETAATQLCTNSANFTFADPFLTSVALTNTNLYQGTFNSFYFQEFMKISELPLTGINATFYGDDSGFNKYFQKQQEAIYQHYEQIACKPGSLAKTVCAFSNITYNQWLDGNILSNPLPGTDGTSDGYVIHYGKYATGWITPEYGFWAMKNNLAALPAKQRPVAIDQTYQAFNISGLYNGKKYQDVLLYPLPADYSEFANFDGYLRSVAINFGLSGVLTVRSPREVIEGYTDPLVAQLATMPIYMGGDATTDPVLALNNPPTHPTNNTVAFFTGVDDYQSTRQYGQWLGQEYIQMKGKQYTSINNIEEYQYSPWKEPVLLDGTDGMQFSPALKTDDVIAAFVNDLSRNCYFDYDHNDDRYPGLDNYIFNIQYALMQNSTANPANENYDVLITGTTNMTSSLNAYGFAGKGHYWQLSEEADSSKPIIKDYNGTVIEPNEDDDDTYLGIEPLSGVCLVAMERIFFNMQVLGDDLFQNLDAEADPMPTYGYFFPLAFVKRESVWTQDQVDDVFGPLVLAQKLKWVMFALLLIFGLAFLVLTVLCGLRYKKLKGNMEPVVPDDSDQVQNAGRGSLNNNDLADHQALLSGTKGSIKDKGYETGSSDADFADCKPNMQQNERPFNLHGQGKPIAEISEQHESSNGRQSDNQLEY